MTYNEPVFGSLVRSIVYQQLSGKAAATIFGRLLAATGDPITPDAILRLSLDEMRAFGLSKQKAAYIRDLAEKTAAEEVIFDKFHRMTNDQIIERLTVVKGIGVWTVQMFLMFSLRRPDVLPVRRPGHSERGPEGLRTRRSGHARPRSKRSASVGGPTARSQAGISGEVSN